MRNEKEKQVRRKEGEKEWRNDKVKDLTQRSEDDKDFLQNFCDQPKEAWISKSQLESRVNQDLCSY